jgi:hypothetical protein
MFQQFRQQMHSALQPQGYTEWVWTEGAIDQSWRMRLALSVETDTFEEYRVFEKRMGDAGVAFAHDAREGNCLSRINRYAASFERGLFKILTELRKLQARAAKPLAQADNSVQASEVPRQASNLPAPQPRNSQPPVAGETPEMPQPVPPDPRVGDTYVAPLGILGQVAVLTDEDPEQFNRHNLSLFAEWRPNNVLKALLIELLATAAWRLSRYSRVAFELFEQYASDENGAGRLVTGFIQDAANMDCFSKLAICEIRVKSTLSKTLKELLK